MIPAPLPVNEAERLAALRAYAVLDTPADPTFDTIANLAQASLHMPIALISLVDDGRQWFKAALGLGTRQTPRDYSFCAHAILQAGTFVVTDATQDARFVGNPLVTGDPGIRFYAGANLLSPQGHALGTLCVIDRQPRGLSEDEDHILRSVARAAGMALDLHKAALDMRRLASTDGLTGLLNRGALITALETQIARARSNAAALALIFVDLDNFKAVNDTLGHHTGDAVLRRAASCLRAAVRQDDLVARIGGDEFAVLLPRATPAQLDAVARRLCEGLSACMAANGWPVSASAGAVHFTRPPNDAGQALALADRCMYAAKTGGKNQHRLHLV